MPPRNAAREELYRRLHADGLTNSEIAACAGVSVSAVSQWLRKCNLEPNGVGNMRDDEREELPAGEETRPVLSCPGYSVSRAGHVYSERGDVPRRMATKPTEAGPRVGLSRDGRLRLYYVASLVLEAWAGPRPAGGLVLFRNGDRQDCRVENLEWRFGTSRIDPAELVRVWQSSGSMTEVAERLGSTPATVYIIGTRLRDRGVPLKSFSRKLSEEDISRLIEIASMEEEA
jgi:transposase